MQSQQLVGKLAMMMMIRRSTDMMTGHHASAGRFDHLKDIAFYYAFVLDKLRVTEWN